MLVRFGEIPLFTWLQVPTLSRGARTYKDTRTGPDQVFGKLEQRQYFFTKKCCLIDINHFILKAEITIDRLKLIRSSMEMIFGVIIESFKIWS